MVAGFSLGMLICVSLEKSPVVVLKPESLCSIPGSLVAIGEGGFSTIAFGFWALILSLYAPTHPVHSPTALLWGLERGVPTHPEKQALPHSHILLI